MYVWNNQFVAPLLPRANPVDIIFPITNYQINAKNI